MTEYETMTYERKGKIGYIMFNRPQSLNAVNDQFERDLPDEDRVVAAMRPSATLNAIIDGV